MRGSFWHGATHDAVSAGSVRNNIPYPIGEWRSAVTLISFISRLDRHVPAQRREHQVERERRELVERIAVGQHQPADGLGIGVDHQLADAAAGVVADQGHVLQSERGDGVADHLGHAHRRQVGALARRAGVRSERPVGQDAAKTPAGQIVCDLGPQPVVDEDAVHEQDREDAGSRPGRRRGSRGWRPRGSAGASRISSDRHLQTLGMKVTCRLYESQRFPGRPARAPLRRRSAPPRRVRG